MNIFHQIPVVEQCDQHIRKIPLEICQMLATPPAFPHHPMTKWVRENPNSARIMLAELLEEYEYRFAKPLNCKCHVQFNGPDTNTQPPYCGPRKFRNHFDLYRYKHRFHFVMRYTKRSMPEWLIHTS